MKLQDVQSRIMAIRPDVEVRVGILDAAGRLQLFNLIDIKWMQTADGASRHPKDAVIIFLGSETEKST
jgi:hypothetical protein